MVWFDLAWKLPRFSTRGPRAVGTGPFLFQATYGHSWVLKSTIPTPDTATAPNIVLWISLFAFPYQSHTNPCLASGSVPVWLLSHLLPRGLGPYCTQLHTVQISRQEEAGLCSRSIMLICTGRVRTGQGWKGWEIREKHTYTHLPLMLDQTRYNLNFKPSQLNEWLGLSPPQHLQ